MTATTTPKPRTQQGPRTATVETLTAEVRVLVVGSRQITLSVAKQLDRRHLAKMEPFGRVRLSTKDSDRHVIGKCHNDGSLVISNYQHADHLAGLPQVDEFDIDGKITVCGKVRADYHHQLTFEGRTLIVFKKAVQLCGVHTQEKAFVDGEWVYKTPGSCPPATTTDDIDNLRLVVTEYDEFVARNKRAAKLPLIVLAGLK